MAARATLRRIELPPAREYDRLRFTPETEWQRRHLLDNTSDLPEDVLVPSRRNVIRVGGYVGLIDTGRVRVELLPRVSPTGSVEEDRQFLLDLLAEAEILPKPRQRRASISMRGHRLLEIVIRSTAVRMLELLAEGAPRRYHPLEEQSTTLRGRLSMRHLSTRLPSQAHLFPIRHAPLQRDHPLTALLSALTTNLLQATRDPESRRLLMQCRHHLTQRAEDRILDSALLDAVVLQPSEIQWQPFYELAAALVGNSAPHPVSSGNVHGQGLVFSMDDLFERLLRVRLRSLVAELGLTLQKDAPQHLLRNARTGQSALALRPDYVVRAGGAHVAVVADAKWKLQPKSDRLQVDRADAYQMTAYMVRTQCEKALLFYPGEAGAQMSTEYQLLPSGQSVTLATVDVAGLVSPSRALRSEAERWISSLLRSCLSISA